MKLSIAFLLTATVCGCQTQPKTEPEVSRPAENTVQPTTTTTSLNAATPAEQLPNANVAVAGIANCQPTSEVSSFAARAMDLADADGNGRVTRDEAQSLANLALGGAFFRADENGDGKVTPEEGREARSALVKEHPEIARLVTQARQASGATPFKTIAQLLDIEYGQTLSLSDARAAVRSVVDDVYRTVDSNKDGLISRNEALSAGASGAQLIGGKAFAAADANHDQRLSAPEFETALTGSAKSLFDLFDSNKDGQLTEAEASAAINAAGLQMGMPQLASKH